MYQMFQKVYYTFDILHILSHYVHSARFWTLEIITYKYSRVFYMYNSMENSRLCDIHLVKVRICILHVKYKSTSPSQINKI